MTATAATPAPSLGDRYAAWSVIVLTALALLAGWGLKSAVEARSVPFDAEGISAQVPDGWFYATEEGGPLLRAADPAAEGFGTQFLIEAVPIPADSSVEDVASLLTLSRGQNLTAYRVLDQAEVTANGQAAYKVTYVFVESSPDMTHDVLPSVVRGLDFIFLDGERAVVVSYHADQSAYEADYGRFRRFLQSVKF